MSITNMILTVLAFALILLVHEFGHFIFSKALGFKVEEFALGFGRKLCSFRKGETEYSLRLIPLGGYNKLPDIDCQNVHMTLSLYWKRFLVLAAGGVFNIVFAVLSIWLMVFAIGIPTSTSEIESIEPNSPAIMLASTPLQEGDKIISINGVQTDGDFDKLSAHTKGANLELEVERGGEILPMISVQKGEGELLGIHPKQDVRDVTFEQSFLATQAICDHLIHMTVDGFKSIIDAGGTKLATSVSGPIGVTAGIYQAKEVAGWHGFILLVALISANIGIMNLLPIPLLDGGRILTDTLQLVTRNALGERLISCTEYVGIVFIFLLFSWGLVGDIYRLLPR